MGKLANDPAGHLQQGSIPEVLHNLDVGGEGDVDEVRLQGNDLQKGPEVVVDAVCTNQVLEFVEDLVHPAQEDLTVV